MCAQVFLGLYMPNILLRGVAGFTGITLSLAIFWTYGSKLPLGA